MKKAILIFTLFLSVSIPLLAQNNSCNPTIIHSPHLGLYMREFNGSLYIADYDALWKSDGTAVGTVKINAPYFNVTDVHNTYWELGVLNNHMYFVTYDDDYSGRQLWKTDGTDAGTVLVKKFPGSSNLNYLTPANGLMFFIQRKDFISFLWATDGTEQGTILIKEFEMLSNPFLVPFNDNVFFAAKDDIHGSELWRSDGTVSGTVMVKDIYPGGSGFDDFKGAQSLAIMNNELYFSGNDGSVPFGGLWKTDGTEAGTVPIKKLGNIKNMKEINGILYFSAYDNPSLYGEELWRSDGTEAGTYMIKDIRPGHASSIYHLSNFVSVGGKVVFAANDDISGTEVWVTDGTEAGTHLLKDIQPGPYNSNPFLWNSTIYDGRLYFSVSLEGGGQEIWTTDGTEEGTEFFYEGSGTKFINFNNSLYWLSEDALMSCENGLNIETSTLNNLKFYPNPIYNELIIENIPSGSSLIISDITGRIFHSLEGVFEKRLTINVSDFNNGIYFVQIKSKDGKVLNKKVLVNR